MNNEIMRKGRFQQKCDTTENWNKAGEHGFVPKKGEIIIYQDFKDGFPLAPKFKSGDGETNINDLPFSSAGIELGEGENSIQQTGNVATASGEASVAFGEQTKATAKWQMVVGAFNKTDADALFIVGNGTTTFDVDRSNAFVVKKDGTGYLGDKKIATEEDIGDIDAALESIIAIQESLIGGNA